MGGPYAEECKSDAGEYPEDTAIAPLGTGGAQSQNIQGAMPKVGDHIAGEGRSACSLDDIEPTLFSILDSPGDKSVHPYCCCNGVEYPRDGGLYLVHDPELVGNQAEKDKSNGGSCCCKAPIAAAPASAFDICHREDDTPHSEGAVGTCVDMYCPGKSIESVVCREVEYRVTEWDEIAPEHTPQDEKSPDRDQYIEPVSDEIVYECADQIGPADDSEDSPPFGPEHIAPLVEEYDSEEDQKSYAEPFETLINKGLSAALGLGVGVPD